ncbi:MAG: SET domain-containing protein [Leptothrix sp. (in: b-proteobacteria)]
MHAISVEMMGTSASVAVVPWLIEAKQLISNRSLSAGETVIADRPLVYAEIDPKGLVTTTWRLVEKILASSSLLEEVYALQLALTHFDLDSLDLRIESSLSRRYKRSRSMIRRIYHLIATNNIASKDGLDLICGHGLYKWLSRANHSCDPNTKLVNGNRSERELFLVAIRDIAAGESVTWNYSSPVLLTIDYISRNASLFHSFGFCCSCSRCIEETPAELRDHPKIERFFSQLLRDQYSVS